MIDHRAYVSAARGRLGDGTVLWDGVVWLIAVPVSAWLRYDGDQGALASVQLVEFSIVAIALQAGISLGLDRLRGRHFAGAIDDAIQVAWTTAVVGAILFVVGLTQILAVPRSVAVIATFVALPLALAPRLAIRLVREHHARPDASSAHRVIVFGAGWGGQQLIRSMLFDAESGHLPVAVLDDDRSVHSRRIHGVPVRGSSTQVAEIARATRADVLVVAIRDVDVEVIRRVSRAATDAGLRVKVIPVLRDMFRPWINISDLCDLDVADLIGRNPVEVDIEAIAGRLAGKVVLVTGAGGSIGSELCRQLKQFEPAELLMLDRDESALHALQLSLHGRALLDSPDVILADIRDAATIERIFVERGPDVVFHAAALKHLPMLEQYPHEAWQSNVVGTANVVSAAVAARVKTFVNISTDKAANPTSVLGRSKRIAERLVAAAGQNDCGTYVSVRFGNVIGSRGSVLKTFAEQLAADRPITVTHPDVTRFFMTIPEAVRLVIQAAIIGRAREALVLDMGAPVRIVDIAKQLMAFAGRPVQLVYTGLRPGEKLHEELFGDGEVPDFRPIHPAVSHVTVPELDASWVAMPVAPDDAAEVMAELLDAEIRVPDAHAVPLPSRPLPVSVLADTRSLVSEQL